MSFIGPLDTRYAGELDTQYVGWGYAVLEVTLLKTNPRCSLITSHCLELGLFPFSSIKPESHKVNCCGVMLAGDS